MTVSESTKIIDDFLLFGQLEAFRANNNPIIQVVVQSGCYNGLQTLGKLT